MIHLVPALKKYFARLPWVTDCTQQHANLRANFWFFDFDAQTWRAIDVIYKRVGIQNVSNSLWIAIANFTQLLQHLDQRD